MEKDLIYLLPKENIALDYFKMDLINANVKKSYQLRQIS